MFPSGSVQEQAGGSSLYSPAKSMNRVTGALEQLRRFYTEAPYSRVGSIDRDNQDTEQPGHI